MSNSITYLLKTPYNKHHRLFALYRYLYWKYIRLTRKENVPFRIWKNRFVLLNHDSFQCMWIMYNYLVDWEEFHFLMAYLVLDDVVADIGANMGFYTIWMSKFIGRMGKIYSFEPDETNYQRLVKNIQLNKLENLVIPVKKGVSNVIGCVPFTKGLDGENHIVPAPNDNSVCIASTTLDAYAEANQIEKFDYIKVDVEGFELSLLQGAVQLLEQRKIGVIQLEINKTVRNSGATVCDILQFLDQHAYVLCHYDMVQRKMIPVTYQAERENYFAVADLQQVNQRLKGNRLVKPAKVVELV